MLIGDCTYYVFVLSKYRKTWNNVIRLVIALQYNITSWSLQNQAVSDRINLYTYLYTTLPRRHHVFSKQNSSLETQGRSRLYYLRFPTMSSEYWPQIHELFLKDELKTKLSGLKMLETAGTRAKLCAFTYNCLLLWGKTSSSILFSTPALDGNHLQLS